MFEIGDHVKVKIGTGLIEISGKIVSTSTDHTYSIKAILRDGKKVVMHEIKEEDIKADTYNIINNLMDKVLEGKVENLKEAKEVKSIVEEMVE